MGRRIREATAGSGKALSLELGGKSPYIVFDDADIDSAVEGLVDAIWFNQGQVCCAGSRLLVHEPVADVFYAKLRARMDKLRIGSPLDKSIDVGAIVDPKQLNAITTMVAANSAGITHVAACEMPVEGSFYPPTLITDLHPADTLMQEEIFGPVLVSTTFRTPEEAVSIANNTRYGLAASVWSENINLALDIAPKLAAGVVWINGTNMMDAAAGFGGVRESGFGREGGWEGLSAYTKPPRKAKPLKQIAPMTGRVRSTDEHRPHCESSTSAANKPVPTAAIPRRSGPKTERCSATRQMPPARMCATQSRPPNAAKGWSKTTGHSACADPLFIAENLAARGDEFASGLTPCKAANRRERGRAAVQTPLHLCRLGRQIRRASARCTDPWRGLGDEGARWRDRGPVPCRCAPLGA